MAELFNAFLSGMERADYDKQARARKEAAKAYTAGDLDWAQNELMGQGLTQEAGQLGTLAEQRKQLQFRKSIADAMQGKADPAAAMDAGAAAAIQGGDWEHYAQIYDMKSKMDANSRATAAQLGETMGAIFKQLKETVPNEADRPNAAYQLGIQAKFDPAQVKTAVDQISAQGDHAWSDQNMDAHARAALGLQQIMASEQWDKQFEEQKREFGISSDIQRLTAGNSGRGQRLTAYQVGQVQGGYTALTQIDEAAKNFENLLKNASPTALAGIGPEGARLISAQQTLALLAKNAFQLGALAGPDMAILSNVIGEPGNIKQLVAQGGKEGAVTRLSQIYDYTSRNRNALKQQWSQSADQLPTMFPNGAAPTLETPASGAPGVPIAPPADAIADLKANPSLAPAFAAKYGQEALDAATKSFAAPPPVAAQAQIQPAKPIATMTISEQQVWSSYIKSRGTKDEAFWANRAHKAGLI